MHRHMSNVLIFSSMDANVIEGVGPEWQVHLLG